jgi:hypothetical protein
LYKKCLAENREFHPTMTSDSLDVMLGDLPIGASGAPTCGTDSLRLSSRTVTPIGSRPPTGGGSPLRRSGSLGGTITIEKQHPLWRSGSLGGTITIEKQHPPLRRSGSLGGTITIEKQQPWTEKKEATPGLTRVRVLRDEPRGWQYIINDQQDELDRLFPPEAGDHHGSCRDAD